MKDIIDIAGVVIATVALLVAIYGIRDVREQVRLLVEIERNREYSKLLHDMMWQFIDPTEKTVETAIAKRMHDYAILARALDPGKSLEALRQSAENEALQTAKDLVDQGSARWKEDVDEEKAVQMIADWRVRKNAARVNSMFDRK